MLLGTISLPFVRFLAAAFAATTLFATAEAAPRNILFDVPGARGTGANAINAQGWVVGNYLDNQNVFHGFLRMPDGTITTVEPGSARNSTVSSINDAGTIAGAYQDVSFTPHIFTRSSAGTFSSFDIPGAADIFGVFINSSGMIAGSYTDAALKQYGFVRALDGTIATISFSTSTTVSAINAQGVVTGSVSNNFNGIGFVRGADGTLTTFQIDGVDATLTAGINNAGIVVGSYQDSKDQQITKGYMRAPDGTITTITVSGAHGQVCTGINDLGWIVGSSWPKPFKHETGFVRKRNGKLKGAAVPGYMVELWGINASGVAVGGVFSLDTGVSHGLLRTL